MDIQGSLAKFYFKVSDKDKDLRKELSKNTY